MIAATLSHYRITEKIGEGGMGIVYRAHDERLDRDIAIKVLPPGALADDAARKRFRKEALALAKLNHPNIETVHDFDTQDETDFLVTEYIPGATLDEKLAGRSLPEKETLTLGRQLAEGLAAAHEQGVVHRDLKPANLRIAPDGRLKILDFGLAKMLQPMKAPEATASIGETRRVMGTVPYMAPEQLRGEATDARTDIWAAGVVLYEMATGQRPFTAELGTRLADDILHQAPPPPSAANRHVSPGLESIILKALEKEPERRYQSARDLAADFLRLSTPSGAVLPVWPRRRYGAWVLVAGVLLVAALATFFGLNVGGVRDRVLGRAAPLQIRSLAVLPLANLSRDPEQEYFADGMTEALITDLSKISALRVISRTSVMQYKEKRKPLPEIAKELNVDAVVEGSVLRVGDRVRITAQLVGATPERHLWANSYDRELRDILALHTDVARAIADEIRATLTPQEQILLTSVRPVNPQAYDLYLRGRYHWNRRTPADLLKATTYFQTAIGVDPNYASAYAGLADSYALYPFYSILPASESFPQARSAAEMALELDSGLVEAHTVMAFLTFYHDWNWAAAESQLKQILQLHPDYAIARQWYVEYLSAMGRHDEALREIRLAQKTEPLSPLLMSMESYVYFYARQHEQAIEVCQKALAFDPNYAITHMLLGRAHESNGEYRKALDELRKADELSGGRAQGQLDIARIYARSGNGLEATKVLGQIVGTSGRSKTLDTPRVAMVYAALGKNNEAMAWLEKAYEQRDVVLVRAKVDPRYGQLRSDPRFQDLLRRMNFPP